MLETLPKAKFFKCGANEWQTRCTIGVVTCELVDGKWKFATQLGWLYGIETKLDKVPKGLLKEVADYVDSIEKS